jgi:hypothetical protein
MGLNYNLHLIENNRENESFSTKSILAKLNINYSLSKDTSFDEMLNTLHSDERALGITEYKGKIVLNDENYYIHEKIIETLNAFKILQIELSSSVNFQHFSYWKNGILIRKKTMGKSDWIDEEELLLLKDTISEEEYEKLAQGDEDFGEKQSFEKNGSSNDDILETCGVPENDLWDLNWKIVYLH